MGAGLAFEVDENLTMSTIRGRNMNAARRYWKPMVTLQAGLRAVVDASGLAIAMPKGVRTLGIEIRFSNHSGFAPDDCYFEDGKESIYQACIHMDGQRLHEGMADEERYWTLWWLSLDALIHVADRFSLPAETREVLAAERQRATTSPPWPPIPAMSEAGTEPVDDDALAAPAPSLANGPGELWVHVHGDGADSVVDALCAVVPERGWGEWSGDSHGSGSSDVSFEVEDMHQAAERISAYLSEAWPHARFLVSDRYEPGDVPG